MTNEAIFETVHRGRQSALHRASYMRTAVWALRFLEAGLNFEATPKPLRAFAETGMKLSTIGNPQAAEESRSLALAAPSVARALKPAVLLGHRLRRWWSCAHVLKAHQYSIYTATHAWQRTGFDVSEPAFPWQMNIDSARWQCG